MRLRAQATEAAPEVRRKELDILMRMTAIITPPGGSALLSWYAVLLQLLLNTCVLLQAVRSAKLSQSQITGIQYCLHLLLFVAKCRPIT